MRYFICPLVVLCITTGIRAQEQPKLSPAQQEVLNVRNALRETALRRDTHYQEDEYTLLGMAIKYAGLRGKEVRVIGKNRTLLKRTESSERDPAREIAIRSYLSVVSCCRTSGATSTTAPPK
jgi:hypothetical protein